MSAGPLVVAVDGSERPGGATAPVLDHMGRRFARQGAQLRVLALRDHRVVGCGPCGDCTLRTEPCAVDDDVPALVEQLVAASCVVYALPVHGFGASSLMQAFVERAGVGHLRFERPLEDRVGGVVVTGRRYAHTEVVAQLQHNMLLNRMVLAGSGFPAVLHTDGLASPLHDAEGVAAVDALVDRMVDVARRLRPAEWAVTGTAGSTHPGARSHDTDADTDTDTTATADTATATDTDTATATATATDPRSTP